MADPEQFRKETRAWLESHCLPEMRQPMAKDVVLTYVGAIHNRKP
jgi:hypothetical protein